MEELFKMADELSMNVNGTDTTVGEAYIAKWAFLAGVLHKELYLKPIISELKKGHFDALVNEITKQFSIRQFDKDGKLIIFHLDWDDYNRVWTMDAFDENETTHIDNDFSSDKLTLETALKEAREYIRNTGM